MLSLVLPFERIPINPQSLCCAYCNYLDFSFWFLDFKAFSCIFTLFCSQWRDGLFTHILRRIVDNVRGEINKRQWIIFDGDVDPEWVENLNSVLDDNKLLTLPNGERLSIPPNVRIMFEVHTLKYATLATVSRCGMVWFSEDILTTEMVMANYLTKLR